jgi:PIN domain nuclease of toxin-antitoxin system
VRLLLDTHVYLWWLSGDPRMPDAVAARISDTATLVHVSAASIWEAAVKAGLGKLDLGGADLVAEIPANGFDELPVTGRHAATAGALPQHHPDPFDRMLVAQAQLEDLTLVTADSRMDAYDVATLEVGR